MGSTAQYSTGGVKVEGEGRKAPCEELKEGISRLP